jgi:hypothetical protein
MPEYKTMKIPVKIYEIFEKYLTTFDTVYDNATTMIQDTIKEKAKELLERLNQDAGQTKKVWEGVNARLDAMEQQMKKGGKEQK